MHKQLLYFLFFLAFTLTSVIGFAQELPEESLDDAEQSLNKETFTKLWINSYGTFRISEKWFWHAELHYRRDQNENTPFVGNLAQIYNRHGIKFIPTNNFSVTAGGVLRFDFSPYDGDQYDDMILEPRIWHEYVWTLPYERFRIYHRFRIEHRWRRGFEKDSDWTFRNRWRYKFMMKIPLNKPKLEPGAFYFNPDVELIMQTGKPVTDNAIEDLRIAPTFAYIASPRVTYSTALMYTTGQETANIYKDNWVIKFNVYINLDFRKFDEKLPETNFYD
ncbi:MAG: DUF2490 domain-containing protein [Bacteroidota bacterium]